MQVGTILLGRIKQVNELDLAVSLPNHLTGFVRIDSISEGLSTRLTRLVDGKGDEESVPNLKELYSPGEPVVCRVVAVEGNMASEKKDQKKPRRRRIELSLMVKHSLESEDSIAVGSVLSGEVVSWEDRGWMISFGGKTGKQGFLPFDSGEGIQVGKTVLCTIASAPQPNARIVQLKAAVRATSINLPPAGHSIEAATVGSLVIAQVTEVKESEVHVKFGGGHVGILDKMQMDLAFDEDGDEVSLKQRYKPGMSLTLRIIAVDPKESTAILFSSKQSILDFSTQDVTVAERLGETVKAARIVAIWQNLGITLALEQDDCILTAFAHISRLSDDHVPSRIQAPYKIGSRHDCRLIDFDWFDGVYQASLQPSLLAQPILRFEDLTPGRIVHGRVARKESYGILVHITDHVRAICPVAHLTETGSPAALEKIKEGQRLRFRVLDCHPQDRKATLTRKTGLLADDALPRVLTCLGDARVGDSYDGYVCALADFGALIRFFGDAKGLATVGELSDDFVDRPQELYFVGQVVRARILKVDQEKGELLVSLRKKTGPKRKDAESIKDESSVKPSKKIKVKKETDNDSLKKAKVEKHIEDCSSVQVEEKSNDFKEVKKANSNSVKMTDKESKSKAETKNVKDSNYLELPVVPEMTLDDFVVEKQLTPAESPKNVGKDKKEKSSVVNNISLTEICEEFEKRLLTAPNDSVLWIQYTSTLLKAGETEMARKLLERSLNTISFRSEPDRLAIWTAYLGLEHAFGTQTTLDQVFRRALVAADPRTVYMRLAQVYEDGSLKACPEDRLAALYETMIRKFGGSCKVWIAYLNWMYLRAFHASAEQTTLLASARKLLTKALKALPRRKHVKASCKVAQLEYRYGSVERARSLFEGILANNPKRLDIWSVYLTMEENRMTDASAQQEQQRDHVRRLFERAVHQKHSSKKAKYLFKRFLEFERLHGDEDGVNRVKQLAQRYVEANLAQ